MTRRNFTATLAAAPLAAVAAPGKETAMNPFQAIFEKSMNEKKGVNVYVNGQTIGMLVTKVHDGIVEGRSQQYSMIAVRIEKIDAAAIA